MLRSQVRRCPSTTRLRRYARDDKWIRRYVRDDKWIRRYARDDKWIRRYVRDDKWIRRYARDDKWDEHDRGRDYSASDSPTHVGRRRAFSYGSRTLASSRSRSRR